MQLALRIVLGIALAASIACDKTTTNSSPDSPTAKKVQMPSAAETTRLAKSSNSFAFDLYGKVRGTPGNLAMSPASITAALAMTLGGARARTEEQMRAVLHLEGPRESLMDDWGKLSRSLQDPGRPLKLRIANRLFGEKTAAFDAGYIDRTKAAYGAPLEALDFKTGFEPAREHINAWVEQQTERRISNLLPLGALDKLTRLVLVNAIYFLADWAEPFEKNSTYDEDFTTAGGAKKRAKMMHRSGGYRYAQVEGMKILEVPYKGDAAMLFFLPDRVESLPAVEQSLSAPKLETWTSALQSERVSVSLPRFEVNPASSISLGDVLVGLGMTDAFDRDKADFTGIANPSDPRERLKIDKVFHKAFVKVDEKGTEAAAATAVVAAAGGAAPSAKVIEFTADHPFLFAIVDRPTGLVLFVGRVADPTTT